MVHLWYVTRLHYMCSSDGPGIAFPVLIHLLISVFLLAGDTSARSLQAKNIHIWVRDFCIAQQLVLYVYEGYDL